VGQNEIERANVARLTEKQRQCMDLVLMRKSSKEIARELGISKPTVDQRITNARQILGARNRDEAAIFFARGVEKYDRVIYDSACVPFAGPMIDSDVQEARRDIGLRLEEAAVPFSGVFEHKPTVTSGFRLSPSGDIGTSNRLLIIVGLTVGILSIVLIGLAVAQSMSMLLTAH
jgi:DNA-binding CsgD family transcriptional regulator